ncbi:MAG TPA: hypothetical protein VGI96_30375 [Streptosporangiaceae bacterium]|jgi:hypothetical protein
MITGSGSGSPIVIDGGGLAGGNAAATLRAEGCARPVMNRTTKVKPLLVLIAILAGTSVGDWVGGTFGAFTAALVSIPLVGALQVTVRELWRVTAWNDSEAATEAAGQQD